MCENLDRFQQSFKSYCSDDLNFELWIRNPFLAYLDAACDDDLAKDDLIELRTMQMLRSNFNSKDSRILVFLDTSLSSPGNESHGCSYSFCYKLPLSRDFRLFLLSKQRNRLDVKGDMRVALSKTIPQFHILVEKKATTTFAWK